jgi:molybdopterin synthase catalytic subunit
VFAITRETIDVAAVENAVAKRTYGATVVFVGVVRRLSDDGRDVSGLSYEAHEAMALAEFARIAEEACARFGDCRIAAAHRIGDLAIGDIAVAVAAGAPHRAQAFDACEYAIDQIKARAAIWKQEHYVDGRSRWRENVYQPPTSPS